MNWWMLAGGAMALICAAGHVAGRGMFYRPIRSDVRSELLGGVFTAMWHIITINFTLSAIALIALSTHGYNSAVASLVAAQFAGYAAVYLAISLRLGGALKLFQWMPFGATAILCALGAIATP